MGKGMVETFLRLAVYEMKHRPFTLISVLVLAAAIAYSWSDFARAEDVDSVRRDVYQVENAMMVLEGRIDKLEVTVRRENLDSQIAAMESELFRIERTIAAAGQTGEMLDPVYGERASQLRAGIAKKARQLHALDREQTERERALTLRKSYAESGQPK